MPNPSQEAAAKEKASVVVNLWLDSRPLVNLSDRDHMALEDSIATALTEARSAALKEAMDRIATLEPVHTGGNYAYAAGFRSGLDAAEIELGRMAGGAEDTSTDVSATPDREDG